MMTQIGQEQGWVEQKSLQIKFQDPGDEVVGILLKSERQSKYNVNWYTLESQGEQIGILGSMQLDRLMLTVQPGDLVKIRLEGFEDVPNGKLKLYRLWVNRPKE